MTHKITPNEFFKWQGAYGAFTVRKSAVERAREYVLNQRTHHAAKNLIEAWEKCETEDSG